MAGISPYDPYGSEYYYGRPRQTGSTHRPCCSVPMNDDSRVWRGDVFGHEHELIIEPGRSERHYGVTCGITANFFKFWLGAISQADGYWGRLGARPPPPDHRGLHNRFRQTRRTAFRCGDGRVRGFSRQLCYSRGPYDLVSIYARPADSPAAIVRGRCVCGELRDRSVDFNVKYRDFRYVVPFIVQLGLCVSPVGFSAQPCSVSVAACLLPQSDGRGDRWASLVPAWGRAVFARLWLSLAVTGFFVWFGIRQFRKMQKSFADLI